MAYGPLKLLSANLLPTTNGTALYTQPSGKMVEIATVLIHNTGATSQTVQLWLSGTNAAARILSVTLAANDTFEFAPKVPLVLNWDSGAGQRGVYATGTTANQCVAHFYGREEV